MASVGAPVMAAGPATADSRGLGRGPVRDDQGLMTLEWLLIVGAIAGLAASTVLIVQQVVDDTSEVPTDPLVRLIEADVEAAFVASEAQAAFDADPALYTPTVDAGYETRCDPGIPTAYSDVAAVAAWALGPPKTRTARRATMTTLPPGAT